MRGRKWEMLGWVWPWLGSVMGLRRKKNRRERKEKRKKKKIYRERRIVAWRERKREKHVEGKERENEWLWGFGGWVGMSNESTGRVWIQWVDPLLPKSNLHINKAPLQRLRVPHLHHNNTGPTKELILVKSRLIRLWLSNWSNVILGRYTTGIQHYIDHLCISELWVA